ncbi:MAG TPA: hypothetical protein DDW85_03340 [Porphyromonadaceae bacterium]|nr:hypothetical protein [Porphyromonadaceae bacterium]
MANYSYSAEKPESVQVIGAADKRKYQLNFETEEVKTDESVTYKSLYAQVSDLEYGTLVSAIIGSKYTSNDIEAILLNNLEASNTESTITDEKREEYIDEYKELQAWRLMAKEIANEIRSSTNK